MPPLECKLKEGKDISQFVYYRFPSTWNTAWHIEKGSKNIFQLMNLKGRMFQHNFREPRFEATKKIAMCSQKMVLKAKKTPKNLLSLGQ